MEFEVHCEDEVKAVIDEDGDLVIKASVGVVLLMRSGVVSISSGASISEFGVTKLIRKGDKVTITF